MAFGGLTKRLAVLSPFSAVLRTPRLGITTAHGRSMEPTLHEGDRVVVLHGVIPRPGRLALVKLPDGPNGPRPPRVKRLSKRSPKMGDGWWIERDNPKAGLDSWEVGAVADDDVLGQVLIRVPAWQWPHQIRPAMRKAADKSAALVSKRRK